MAYVTLKDGYVRMLGGIGVGVMTELVSILIYAYNKSMTLRVHNNYI